MKIEALVELVRAIGETVQQLSGLVEGMPKAVDAKLASMRETLLGEVRQIRCEVGSLRTEFVELQSDCGAMRALFDATATGLRENTAQIIADNRAEFDTRMQSFNDRIENVSNAVDDNRRQTEAAFGEVDEKITATMSALTTAVEEQRAYTLKVRSECDTVGLYHAVKKLENAVAAGEEGHQQLAGKVDSMMGDFTVQISGLNSFGQDLAKQISDNETIVLGWRNEDTARVQSLEKVVDTVDKAHTRSIEQLWSETSKDVTELRTSVSQLTVDVSTGKDALALATEAQKTLGNELWQGIKDVAGHVAETRNALTTITSTVEGTIVRVEEVDNAVKEITVSIEELAQQPAFTRTEAETMVAAVQDSLSSRIAEVVVQASSGDEALSQRIAALPTVEQIVAAVPVEVTMAGVQQLFVAAEETAFAAIAEARAVTSQQVDAVVSRVVALEEGSIKYAKTAESVQDAIEQTLNTHGEALKAVPTREEVETAIEASRQNMLNSLTAATLESQAARSALVQCRDTLPKLEEMLEVVSRSVSHEELETAIGAVQDGTNSRLADIAVSVETVAGTVREIGSRIETLPPPFDPEPLKQWVGEQFKALPPPELHFDVATSAGDEDTTVLALTFGVGDNLITKEVPLGIGFGYRGVYDKNEEYNFRNFVTHKGSIWYAKAKPTGEPGKDIEGWQLAVKCGRDGKDAPAVRSLKPLRDPATGLASEYRLDYGTDTETDKE